MEVWWRAAAFVWLSIMCLTLTHAEVLTPPYFNLAENRRITATASCGDQGPEVYCRVATTTEPGISNNAGQICDYCDYTTTRSHPPRFAIDGSERWWQSPPLSRGLQYREVNLTVDLGQEFDVAYVFITMANSPRPGVWALERSTDNGKSWQPWQYFAENTAQCQEYFGTASSEITADDSVICDTTFSRATPTEGGEIVVSLLSGRPSAQDFFGSPTLQQWTRATAIRLRLLRPIIQNGDILDGDDLSVSRRYFYSIKDVSIGGRCECSGHADTCDIPDPEDRFKLLCRCQHNTCGAQCDTCCPGYQAQKWRPSTYTKPFACEPEISTPAEPEKERRRRGGFIGRFFYY